MDIITSVDARAGECILPAHGEPARVMKDADQPIPENCAGQCHTPDEAALSMTSAEAWHEERDEAWKEFRLFSEIQTAAARGAQLAATLPQELLDHIITVGLFKLDVFDAGENNAYIYMSLAERMHQKAQDAGSWALVCLDWARRCRRLMHRKVIITSRISALRFRALVKGPCSDRLTPLLDLIEKLDVMTSPKTDEWSWHHLLTTIVPAIPANKFARLYIKGDTNWAARTLMGGSIHWGVPSSFSALPAPYRKLELSNLWFVSLQDLFRLVCSLPRLEKLDFLRVTWDNDQTRAPVGHVAHRRQTRSTWTHVQSYGCQNNILLQLRTFGLWQTPMQVIPATEQDIIAQLVENIDVVNRAMWHVEIFGLWFLPFAHTSSQTSISGSWLCLGALDRHVQLCCHYHQTIVGCTVLISHDAPHIPLTTFAWDHLWRSLAHLPDLRYLIVGLSDVNTVKVLAETHQALWESLHKKLYYHRFASQPEAGQLKRWVAHDPNSLEQTGEEWEHFEEVAQSLANKI